MGKVLGIDYGLKRTGIAITDALQIIASGLTTIPTHSLDDFISNIVIKEDIECFVVGNPKNLDGTNTDMTLPVKRFINRLQKLYLDITLFKSMKDLLLKLLKRQF